MEKDEAKAKLDAYLDPKLDEAARAGLEASIMGEPAVQAELEALKAVDAEVRDLPAPDAPEGYFDGFGKRLAARLDDELPQTAPGGDKAAAAGAAPAAAMSPEMLQAVAFAASAPPAGGREETSGLRDLRKLARTTTQSNPVIVAAPTASDLSGVASRSSVVGLKVDVPEEPRETVPAPSWAKWAVGGVAALVVVVVSLSIILMSKKDEPAAPVIAMNQPAPAAPMAAAPAAPAAAPAPVAEPAAGAASAEAKAEGAGKSDKAEEGRGKGSGKAVASARHAGAAAASAGGGKGASAAKPAAATGELAPSAMSPVAEERPAPKKAGGNDLDSLLESATKQGSKGPRVVAEDDDGSSKKKAAEAPSEGTGEVSINDLRKVLEGLQPKMRQCFKKFQIPGVAEITVVVAPTGKLQGAPQIKGDFVGTPTGDCAVAQVKTASFPKFKGSPMSLTFPFNLH